MSFGLNEEQPLPGEVSIPFEAYPERTFPRDRIGYFHNALGKFARMMDADFYAPPSPSTPSYRYLNSAALPNPVDRVRNEARCVFALWSRGELTYARKQEILETARREAAALVNLKDERGVILCRNASEALSYFLSLSGIMEEHKYERWPTVVTTDAENPSIQREIFIIKDHSNADRKDAITTYPEFASQRPLNYTPPEPRATGLRWGHFQVARVDDQEALIHLHEFMKDENPSVLILSHVLRTTGRELPIAEWVKKAREWKAKYHPHNPDLFVCIDGAQALGNINVDVNEYDCDMYVGCGQKALQGETVGLLYVNLENERIQKGLDRVRALRPDTQVILHGMFHEDLDVEPNVDDDVSYADIAGFTANLKRLKKAGMINGNDLFVLSAHRLALRQRCAEGIAALRAFTEYPITILDQHATTFILSFRLGFDPFLYRGEHNGPEGLYEPGAMHNQTIPAESSCKKIAQMLHERGVGIAFLRRGNIFRVSFADQTTMEDVEAFLSELKDIISTDFTTFASIEH